MALISDGWRAAGLLLHPSCLYSSYGIGDLGPSARHLLAFMKKAGFHYWQVLPLAPTSPGLGNSPYSAYSAFAGNPLFISPDLMVRDGWLEAHELKPAEVSPTDQVNFEKVAAAKEGLLDLAFEKAEAKLEGHCGFQGFAWDNGAWLNDFSFFMAARKHFNQRSWLLWPESLKRRDDRALHDYGTRLARAILREKFAQYLFFSQLCELKELMSAEGLGFIGDAAIYVNLDSSDVWAQPHLYCLAEDGRPLEVAGVPPDYFSEDGQLWGNPLFQWEAHRAQNFDWWKNRLWYMLKMYDWVRLDHFRAFAAYWAVPAGAETAAKGFWRPGPGADLFLEATAGRQLRIIAEDLGIITPDVTALRKRFGYPGMRVLQFAFGPEMASSNHAPFRVEADNVIYSATHDNNTSRGWYRQEADKLIRRQVSDLAGYEVTEENAAWALVRLAWLSSAALAVAPLQDLLNLDEKARLNRPGTAQGNWGWKMTGPEFFDDRLADRLAELTDLSGRDNRSHPNILSY